jgi:membrane associated rhomboid family serine protease/Flp pilus assembly protein TadD
MPGLPFGKKTCHWCLEYEAHKRGETDDDAVQRVMPAPWVRGASSRPVTQAIFGINVAVYLGMALAGVSLTDPTSQELVHWGANSVPLTLSGDWWRLVTNIFLHMGFIHIALNMWCLWSLGTLAESLYGSWTYAAVYLICGVSGSVASAWWHPYGLSAGASGAIFGIAGALVASITYGEFSLARSLVWSQLSCLLAFLAYSLLFGVLSGTTDNAAHLGGLGAGFLLGAVIARAAPERNAWLARCAVIGIAAVALGGAGLLLERAHGGEARINRVYQLLGQQQGPEGIRALERLVRKDPKFITGHYALASAYQRSGRYREAEAELVRILQIEPDNRWANYRLGMNYLSENKIVEAKKLFSSRVAVNASDYDAHYGLGLTLAAEGDHEAAIREFKTVTQLEPDASGAFYGMGNSYHKLKKYDEAIAVFQAGQKQAGDDSYLESGLAAAYEAKGMKSEAAEAERKAAQLKTRENDD